MKGESDVGELETLTELSKMHKLAPGGTLFFSRSFYSSLRRAQLFSYLFLLASSKPSMLSNKAADLPPMIITATKSESVVESSTLLLEQPGKMQDSDSDRPGGSPLDAPRGLDDGCCLNMWGCIAASSNCVVVPLLLVPPIACYACAATPPAGSNRAYEMLSSTGRVLTYWGSTDVNRGNLWLYRCFVDKYA